MITLSIVALATVSLSSCSKKSECICVDKDGSELPLDLSGQGNAASRKMFCDLQHQAWKQDGGKCSLK